jgi:hypothetical protein
MRKFLLGTAIAAAAAYVINGSSSTSSAADSHTISSKRPICLDRESDRGCVLAASSIFHRKKSQTGAYPY